MSKTTLAVLSLVSLLTACVTHRIAIIGGGVGGTSNAFFLREQLGKDTHITIFERGNIGGRLASVDIGGMRYDSGGSIVHSANAHAKKLTKRVDLKREKLEGTGGTGFYDGSQYVLSLTGSKFSDKMKVGWRYGVGVKDVVTKAEDMIHDLGRIYCLQEKFKVPFATVGDLLNSTSPQFLKMVNKEFGAYLTDIGVAENVQTELVHAALRTNYNQDLSVNAFVGFVSLAGGLVGDLWRVDGGNWLLPRKLAQHSGAVLKNSKVISIEKSDKGYKVTSESVKDGSADSEEFDVVVVATPLHDADIALPSDIVTEHQPFQRTVATFVNGKLRQLVPGKKNPEDILIVKSNPDVFFSSIGHKGKAKKDFNYKVFSKLPLTEEQISKLFETVHESKVVDWMAYPKYSVPGPLPAFELAPGLYHINAIESAASAIEMSLIGSKNVALLIEHHLKGTQPPQHASLCRSRTRAREDL